MTDGIIKGGGNSRFLRSVPNVRTLYPTYDDLLEALAAGTFPIDLNGINPSGWQQTGDKLDKATLLTDALCSALGLATTATPTQAMEKLRQLTATAQNTANLANTNASNRAKIEAGSYTGTYTWSNSTESIRKINFSIVPTIVFIQGSYGGSDTMLIRGCNTGYNAYENDTFSVSWTNYSVQLSISGYDSTHAPQIGFNQSGALYFYVAI